MNIPPLFPIVNWIEVFLWPVFGLICLGAVFRKEQAHRRSLILLGITFFLFGYTDYLELHTGAWWRPMGLLALNALCVSVFLIMGVRFLRGRRERG